MRFGLEVETSLQFSARMITLDRVGGWRGGGSATQRTSERVHLAIRALIEMYKQTARSLDRCSSRLIEPVDAVQALRKR